MNGKGDRRRPCLVSREEAERNWDRIFPKATVKLYRLKDIANDKFYRHRYSQFRGGDWVDAESATIWTKPGGASGALGAVREKWPHEAANFVVETAIIDPANLEWKS